MKYGINLCYNDIADDEEAVKIVNSKLPGFEMIKNQHAQTTKLAFSTLGKYMPQMFTQSALEELDAALKEYGKDKGFTKKELEKMAKYQEMEAKRKEDFKKKSAGDKTKKYDAFHPGQEWRDTDGELIQAHAGQVFYEDGFYYWYGENKEFTRGEIEPDNSIWTWGIRCYKSQDLYNWDDLGLIVEPVLTDPDSNLFPDVFVDRPHIVKCAATNKYVMWIKVSGTEACFVVLQADAITGPYELVAENVKPMGYDIGDFDMTVDEETGKCYMFADASHQKVATFVMEDDYLSVKEEVAACYEKLYPPLNREGMTLIDNGSKKYLLTSGTTGYTPNQCDYAVSDSWDEPMVSKGDPHVGDDSYSSFNSQPSQIFRVQGTDKYICIADRWMPDHLLEGDMALRFRTAIASRYEPDKYEKDDEAMAVYNARPDIERCNTSVSRYVWLPVEFVGEKMVIKWYDSWKY
ncbi:MAG: family 43 glycosylhydrolase [Lachnospiraceae bacterium]|nr:family 43 glycosylhydrolase [Lachnospiraceae bacterium]